MKRKTYKELNEIAYKYRELCAYIYKKCSEESRLEITPVKAIEDIRKYMNKHKNDFE